jgi:capsular polysaccharide biosynthesis protein
MNGYDDEINLMDYLNVLWKRKWLIIIPTLIIVIIVGVRSFFLPKVWEIDALIQPSKYLIEIDGGEISEVIAEDPKQIASRISEAAYNSLIAEELNMEIRSFPGITAENINNTNLIRVSLKEQDVEKAKLILLTLFNHLKKDLDRKIDVEIKNIDTRIANNEHITIIKNLDIKSKEIEKSKVRQEILSAQNKLKISEERYINISEEMKTVKKRIDEIEKQQREALSEKKEGRDALSLLLYSNEIQQNLRYYNMLDESSSDEKIIQENLRLVQSAKEKDINKLDTEIEKLKNEIEDIKSQIDFLNEKKGRVDHAQLIKEPTSSLGPVSPKKRRMVILAGILSLIGFTMLSFFLEYIEKQKSKN